MANKYIDCVQMQRDIKEKLSARYSNSTFHEFAQHLVQAARKSSFGIKILAKKTIPR